MLTQVRLENFKGFRGQHEANLAPITLIFGPNSSGKSALIQSLALVSQSAGDRRQRSRGPVLDFAGDWVDLGGFRNTVSGHDELEAIGLGASISPEVRGLPIMALRSLGMDSVSYDTTFSWDASEHLVCPKRSVIRAAGRGSFEVEMKDARISNSEESRGGRYWTSDLVINPASLERLADWLRSASELRGQIERQQPEARRHPERNFPELSAADVQEALHQLNVRQDTWTVDWRGPFPDLQPIFSRFPARRPSDGVDTPTSRNRRAIGEADFESQPTELMALDSGLSQLFTTSVNLISMEFGRMSYLGPMRAAPQRLEETQSRRQMTMGADGGGATYFLYRDPSLRDRVNEALRRMEIDYTVQAVPILNANFPTVGEYLALQLKDLRTGMAVSPRDVGYGLSQLLPVLIEAKRLSRSSLLVEQPELHLHPRLQASLAEIVAESTVTTDSQVILETHSENTVLRLQRMIREGRLSAEQVQVLFVGATPGKGSWIQHINFNPNGSLQDEWPYGFFEDRMAEY